MNTQKRIIGIVYANSQLCYLSASKVKNKKVAPMTKKAREHKHRDGNPQNCETITKQPPQAAIAGIESRDSR